MRQTDWTFRSAVMGIACLSVGAVATLLADTTDPNMLHLGVDVWFLAAGVLVTVGINLEQLRRVRADVKDMRASAKEAEDDGHKSRAVIQADLVTFRSIQMDEWHKMDTRMARVEETLTFLRTRRREDRLLDGAAGGG